MLTLVFFSCQIILDCSWSGQAEIIIIIYWSDGINFRNTSGHGLVVWLHTYLEPTQINNSSGAQSYYKTMRAVKTINCFVVAQSTRCMQHVEQNCCIEKKKQFIIFCLLFFVVENMFDWFWFGIFVRFYLSNYILVFSFYIWRMTIKSQLVFHRFSVHKSEGIFKIGQTVWLKWVLLIILWVHGTNDFSKLSENALK